MEAMASKSTMKRVWKNVWLLVPPLPLPSFVVTVSQPEYALSGTTTRSTCLKGAGPT